MGHKNKESLVRQVQVALDDKLRIGESKHQAKKEGTASEGIYSWNTYRTYMRHCNYFTAYCKENHNCRTLQECRQYVDEWLESRSSLSAYTQKLEASALAKLYGCHTTDFVATQVRHREDITRSRGEKTRDKHFSEEKNSEFVEFCKHTGLRRDEITRLHGDQLIQDEDGHYYIEVVGKGGRYRQAPVLDDDKNVVDRMTAAGSGKVWEKIPNGADIHSYRSEYATSIYKAAERPLEACKANNEVYHCRGDKKGVWMDKRAMLEASRALGHNRISVVGAHYIR